MLSSAKLISQKLAIAISESGVSQADIARECKVTKQAVQGWLKTGRVDKQHLPKLVQVTKKPLEWWFTSGDGMEVHVQALLSDLSMVASPRSLAVIQTLSLAARKNKLSEQDWQLLELIAARLINPKQADPPTTSTTNPA